MAKKKAENVDSKALKEAQGLWIDFTNLMKWSSISVAIILVLMAIFLL